MQLEYRRIGAVIVVTGAPREYWYSSPGVGVSMEG